MSSSGRCVRGGMVASMSASRRGSKLTGQVVGVSLVLRVELALCGAWFGVEPYTVWSLAWCGLGRLWCFAAGGRAASNGVAVRGGVMRSAIWMLAVGLVGAGCVARAQVLPPPSILKEDCGTLKGKSKKQCEARNAAGDAPAAVARPSDAGSDMPTGADADVPGEPPSPRPAQGAKAAAKPNTSDMPMGKDADPPASSMGPLKPDGTPDTEGPPRPPSSSSSSSSSSSGAGGVAPDDDDVAPTTSGGDTPVKATTLKDLGSHADSSAGRVKLEKSRVTDDVKVGRFYLRDGDLAGAEARFKDALQHDPEDPDAHFAMAELLLKQKRNVDAAAQLKRYLELAPDDEHTKDAKKMLAKLGK